MDMTLIWLGWVVMIFAIQLLKRMWVDQKNATILLSLLIWVAYFAYSNYIDPAIQEQIMTDVVAIVGSAKIIYDFITSLLSTKGK